MSYVDTTRRRKFNKSRFNTVILLLSFSLSIRCNWYKQHSKLSDGEKWLFQARLLSTMQIKTWKLRNQIFFFTAFFINQHCKDKSVSRQRSSVPAMASRYSLNLQASICSQLAHCKDHDMSHTELYSITPAREINVLVYLRHEMIGLISYQKNPGRLLHRNVESWFLSFIFVMDF